MICKLCITVIGFHVTKDTTVKYTRNILLEIKGKFDISVMVVVSFNTPYKI